LKFVSSVFCRKYLTICHYFVKDAAGFELETRNTKLQRLSEDFQAQAPLTSVRHAPLVLPYRTELQCLATLAEPADSFAPTIDFPRSTVEKGKGHESSIDPVKINSWQASEF
jgi:hypothetical protein